MIFMTLALAAAAHRPVMGATDLAWRRYTNVRYGYFTCYPSRLMVPEPAVDTDDGRTFRSTSGAELRVWGSYAIDGVSSLSTEVESIKTDLAVAGGAVTYNCSTPNWTVISGRSSRQIFWAKIARRDDRIVVVELVHPAAQSSQYGPVAKELNACSTIGTAPF